MGLETMRPRPLGVLSVAEAAKRLGIGKQTLYAAIRSGSLKAVRRPGVRGYRIREAALEEWVDSAWEPVVPAGRSSR